MRTASPLLESEGFAFYRFDINHSGTLLYSTCTTITTSDIDPPEDVPTEVLQILEESDDSQLRDIIHYVQQLLRDHPSLTEAVEAREGEDLVRIDDHGAYTTVILERPDETGDPGAVAYRVRWEPNIDDDGGSYKWHYLGRVAGEAES